LSHPGAHITVVDKEDRVGAHQTSHNSGVVHAGLYYQPGSLKALLCRQGRSMLEEYCRARDLPYVVCGKVVVARSEAETGRLADIEKRSIANQVPGLRRLDPAGLRSVEPHARGVAALHSPFTAIADFPAVARAFADDVRAAGGTIRLGFEVTTISAGLVSNGSEEIGFDLLVVCAGLQADRVGRLGGDGPEPAIVPFRGEYYRLKPHRTDLVRGLIYPVPDPRYPFLGIHLTRTVGGDVDIGPNAVLATSREGYSRRSVNVVDLKETLSWPGFRRLARRHWRTGVRELYGSLSRRAFVAAARDYVPELSTADVVRAGAGVRAQAVDRDGSIVDDFRINRIGPVITIRNAPSPAATSSMAIADHVITHFVADSI
jgi:L-2-hydroxyglutarate oxidase LhgO